MSVHYAEAGTAYAGAAADLWIAANAARKPGFSADRGVIERLIAVRARDSRTWFFVARDSEGLAGMVHALPAREDDGGGSVIPGLLHVSMLAVRPAAWGRGIAREMLRRTIVFARARAYDGLQLWTPSDNHRALALYAGLGFARSGRAKIDDRGDSIVHLARAVTAGRATDEHD